MAKNSIYIGLIIALSTICVTSNAQKITQTTTIDMCCEQLDLSDGNLNSRIEKAKSGRAGDFSRVAFLYTMRNENKKAVKWYRMAALAPDGYASAFSDYALSIKETNSTDYLKYMRLAIALKNDTAIFHALDQKNSFPLDATDARFWINMSYLDSGRVGLFSLCEDIKNSRRDDLIIGLIFKGDKSFSSWSQALKDQYRECRPTLVQAVREKRLVRSAVREATLQDPSNPNEVEPNLWK